jgi:hypothetical protein
MSFFGLCGGISIAQGRYVDVLNGSPELVKWAKRQLPRIILAPKLRLLVKPVQLAG